MSLNLVERHLVAEGAHGITASDADIDEFRANLAVVRNRRRNLLTRFRHFAGRQLAIPLAILHGLRGLGHYGPGVKKRYNVGLFEQFRCLSSDHFSYRILPESFYMYQLYRAENRGLKGRHFAHAEILPMQQYLIDASCCEDFPLLRSKQRFAQRCSEVGLPTVPILAEFADGKMMAPSLKGDVVFPPADLFSKPSEYWCGIGANLWRYESPGRYVNSLSNESYDRDSLVVKLCAESKSGPIVLQAKASNHSSITGVLTTGGLATVRLVTCRTPSGSIDFLPASIRMPIRHAIVDNIAQGGLAAPIDLATGEITGPAIQKDKGVGVSRFEKHPDTGANLVGIKLPVWEKVLALAIQAHGMFPSMPFVGWDIAILRDGPVVLEGNSWWDVDLSILPHRMCLSDTQFIPYYNFHLRRAIAKSI
jgi:Sugar-transfer associated ATP-grasp